MRYCKCLLHICTYNYTHMSYFQLCPYIYMYWYLICLYIYGHISYFLFGFIQVFLIIKVLLNKIEKLQKKWDHSAVLRVLEMHQSFSLSPDSVYMLFCLQTAGSAYVLPSSRGICPLRSPSAWMGSYIWWLITQRRSSRTIRRRTSGRRWIMIQSAV